MNDKIKIENELSFIGKGLDLIRLMLLTDCDLKTFMEFTNQISNRMEKLTSLLKEKNNKQENI